MSKIWHYLLVSRFWNLLASLTYPMSCDLWGPGKLVFMSLAQKYCVFVEWTHILPYQLFLKKNFSHGFWCIFLASVMQIFDPAGVPPMPMWYFAVWCRVCVGMGIKRWRECPLQIQEWSGSNLVSFLIFRVLLWYPKIAFLQPIAFFKCYWLLTAPNYSDKYRRYWLWLGFRTKRRDWQHALSKA